VTPPALPVALLFRSVQTTDVLLLYFSCIDIGRAGRRGGGRIQWSNKQRTKKGTNDGEFLDSIRPFWYELPASFSVVRFYTYVVSDNQIALPVVGMGEASVVADVYVAAREHQLVLVGIKSIDARQRRRQLFQGPQSRFDGSRIRNKL